MTGRPVTIHTRKYIKENVWEPVVQEGTFLGWGVDYEELRDGVGQYTAAIVEFPGGEVALCPVHTIRFVKEPADV